MKIEDLIKEINILDVKPNQTLVVKLKGQPSYEEATTIRKALKESLTCKILLMSDNVELSVIDTNENTNN